MVQFRISIHYDDTSALSKLKGIMVDSAMRNDIDDNINKMAVFNPRFSQQILNKALCRSTVQNLEYFKRYCLYTPVT